jgi:hypothetical protein
MIAAQSSALAAKFVSPEGCRRLAGDNIPGKRPIANPRPGGALEHAFKSVSIRLHLSRFASVPVAAFGISPGAFFPSCPLPLKSWPRRKPVLPNKPKSKFLNRLSINENHKSRAILSRKTNPKLAGAVKVNKGKLRVFDTPGGSGERSEHQLLCCSPVGEFSATGAQGPDAGPRGACLSPPAQLYIPANPNGPWGQKLK